ncbi:hypothetical protein E2C01_078451 [Portunus trituberculatus]|uniref:Uncharacterized protein n=1 Tax=Portunus trituberculatus TaxID=210409 RepID=A0A5B7IMY0_PORTR|nr:hypothetical protein [Portunus trituberculatus]
MDGGGTLTFQASHPFLQYSTPCPRSATLPRSSRLRAARHNDAHTGVRKGTSAAFRPQTSPAARPSPTFLLPPSGEVTYCLARHTPVKQRTLRHLPLRHLSPHVFGPRLT